MGFQVHLRFLYVLHYGRHRVPHAHGRTRVTMVTRLCARVQRSVWFGIGRSPCWLGNSSDPLAVTDGISKLTLVLLYVLDSGNHGGPHARGRARVTMATRLCARVEQPVVWFRIGKSPCWLGNSSGPLAVTSLISKLTCVLLCAFFVLDTSEDSWLRNQGLELRA